MINITQVLRGQLVNEAGVKQVDASDNPIYYDVPVRLINNIPRLVVDTEIKDVVIGGDVYIENMKTAQYNATLPTIADEGQFIINGSSKGIPYHAITNGATADTVDVLTTQADSLTNNSNGLITTGLNYVFNGTTWDRAINPEAFSGTATGMSLDNVTDEGTGMPVALMMGYDNTTGAEAYRAVAVNDVGEIETEIDGVYAATNTDPDNVGIIGHANAAAPADANQTVRVTAGVSTDATIVSANMFGLDTRSKIYGVSGANQQEIEAVDIGSTFGIGTGIFDASGNRMPVMDVNTRAGFVKITDGAQEWSIDASGFGQVDIAAQTLTAVKVSKDANANLVTNPIFAEITDGTTGVVVETDGTKKALNVNITDGTNDMPTMDAEARAGFVKITDGTDVADVIIQDSAFGTVSKGLPLFGKYEATPTTYTDGDACPIALDANGRIALSSDIQIGAVELKDGDSDTRVDIETDGTKNAMFVQANDLDIRDIDKGTDDILIYANTVKDGSGTSYVPLVDSDAHLQVDVLTDPAISNATDDILVYGYDYAAANQKLKVDSSGKLYIAELPAITGSVTADTELLAPAAITDTYATPTITQVNSFGMNYNGTTWDMVRGDATNGLLVNLGTNNDVTVTGTVTASATDFDIRDLTNATDSVAIYGSDDGGTTKRIIKTDSGGAIQVDLEVASVTATCVGASTPADNFANPTTAIVSQSFNQVWDGATWDLMKGDSTDGLLVNLGSNNDVTLATLPDTAAGDLATISADTTSIDGKITVCNTGAIAGTVSVSNMIPAVETGLATSANQLPDGHNVTIDNASGAAAVNIQDGGNTITVDGTVAISNTSFAVTQTPTVYNATGAAALALSTSMAAKFKLNHITVHFSGPVVAAESITLTLNANDGAAYDTVLYSVVATGGTDFAYVPSSPMIFESGDELDLAFTNTDTLTYGARIVVEAI